MYRAPALDWAAEDDLIEDDYWISGGSVRFVYCGAGLFAREAICQKEIIEQMVPIKTGDHSTRAYYGQMFDTKWRWSMSEAYLTYPPKLCAI